MKTLDNPKIYLVPDEIVNATQYVPGPSTLPSLFANVFRAVTDVPRSNFVFYSIKIRNPSGYDARVNLVSARSNSITPESKLFFDWRKLTI